LGVWKEGAARFFFRDEAFPVLCGSRCSLMDDAQKWAGPLGGSYAQRLARLVWFLAQVIPI
jgi:hypothetical protein